LKRGIDSATVWQHQGADAAKIIENRATSNWQLANSQSKTAKANQPCAKPGPIAETYANLGWLGMTPREVYANLG
jgi:hypothetical protein